MTTREMRTTNGGEPLLVIAIIVGIWASYKIGYNRGRGEKSSSGGSGGGSLVALAPEL